MRLLLTAESFEREYGGPAISVSELARELVELGTTVILWAADGSAVHSPVISEIIDRSGSRELLVPVRGALAEVVSTYKPNIIHDNGLWQMFHHALSTLSLKHGIPRVVSLRGMLEPWALSQKSWRKKMAMGLYQRNDLACAQIVHATSQEEAENFKRFGIDSRVCIVPNGVDIPVDTDRRDRNMDGYRRMLFMSRLHPKKGIPILLDAMRCVDLTEWKLNIVGPDQHGHLAEVQRLIQQYGFEDKVEVMRPLYGQEKEDMFADAELFVLPTHSENFGMVVAEALARSLPVLTTTGAPWSELKQRNCGWWVDPTVEGVANGLKEALDLPRGALRRMGANGRDYVTESFDWPVVGERWQVIYESVVRT